MFQKRIEASNVDEILHPDGRFICDVHRVFGEPSPVISPVRNDARERADEIRRSVENAIAPAVSCVGVQIEKVLFVVGKNYVVVSVTVDVDKTESMIPAFFVNDAAKTG